MCKRPKSTRTSHRAEWSSWRGLVQEHNHLPNKQILTSMVSFPLCCNVTKDRDQLWGGEDWPDFMTVCWTPSEYPRAQRQVLNVLSGGGVSGNGELYRKPQQSRDPRRSPILVLSRGGCPEGWGWWGKWTSHQLLMAPLAFSDVSTLPASMSYRTGCWCSWRDFMAINSSFLSLYVFLSLHPHLSFLMFKSF